MTNSDSRLTLKHIFLFWLPLAATWLMMSVEGPFLSALIARLADPKFNLAAYGVAFSFALIIEAPVIMMMSASTALVKDLDSFKKLRNFTYALNGLITLVMLILIIPPIFYFIAEDLIGLPNKVAYLTHIATIILLPWPATIGYRRFYQGILIRNNLTRRVAYGTIIRITSMAATALIFFLFFDVPGVVVGASALSVAVTFEAAASKIMAWKIVKSLSVNENLEKLNYKGIYDFYYPLAITSLLTLGVQPLVTFFIGQSRMSLESLAVMPVITSFVFIFRSLGLSYQEVVIALIGERSENYKPLRNFAAILGLTLTAVLITIAFTPLSNLWFEDVSGLSNALSRFAETPLMIMSLFPMLTVLISFQRAALVNSKITKPITFGTALEFLMIIIVLYITIEWFSLVGAIAATISFVIGRISANTYLTPPFLKALRKYN